MFERIAERVSERDAGRPIGLLPKTRGIERDPGRVSAADARRIELGADGDSGESEERVQDLGDRNRAARADIERPALAKLHRRSVRARHVPHVDKVTLRIEPAVLHDGLGESRFGLGDLLRERRCGEPGMLPRAVLICRPQDDDGRRVTCRELAREGLGREVWMASRARHRADVGKLRDAVRPQERHELVEGSCGMADRVDHE